MNALEKLSNLVGKYMAFIVLVIAALTFFIPSTGLWVKGAWIQPLLQIVMFGMGLTLSLADFKLVFKRPKDVLVGCAAQFLIMPLIAFALTYIFGLDAALTIGVILVGTCPGGTSSNVITYLSKGDVALSVTMTSFSTILAPILTPAITYLLAGSRIDMDPASMFLSIVKVVIIPIAGGVIINRLFHKFTVKVAKVLPLISITAIVLIVASVVSANAANIASTGLVVIAVVIIHNLAGYGLGLLVAKACKMDLAKAKAVSIEVGMQNSGLAVTLATAHFAQYPLAAVPGAIFSVWHNISGALMASVYARMGKEKDK